MISAAPQNSFVEVDCLNSVVCMQEAEFPRPLKRSSGIPNSFMKPVEDVNQPGVMRTSGGQLVVPTIDAYALVLLDSGLAGCSFVSSDTN